MLQQIIALLVFSFATAVSMEKSELAESKSKIPTLKQLVIDKIVTKITSEYYLHQCAKDPKKIECYALLPIDLQDEIIHQIKPKLWNYIDPKVSILQGHKKTVYSLAYNRKSTQLASGSGDKTICIWDTQSGNLIKKLQGHTCKIYSLNFSSDGNYLVSGSGDMDKRILIWDLSTGKAIQALIGHQKGVMSAVFTNDDSHILSGANDSTIRMWDVKTGNCITVFNYDRFHKVTFNSNLTQFVLRHDDSIALYDALSGNRIKTLSKDFAFLSILSPNNKKLASNFFKIRIHDIESGTIDKTLATNNNNVMQMSFNPDGTKLAFSVVENSQINIWNLKDEVRKLEGHQNYATALLFSPDGNQLASGSDDKTVRILDVSSFITPEMSLKEAIEKLSKVVINKKNK